MRICLVGWMIILLSGCSTLDAVMRHCLFDYIEVFQCPFCLKTKKEIVPMSMKLHLKSCKKREKSNDLINFVSKMNKILTEKFEKYQDTWKTCNLEVLTTNLKNQIEKLDIESINENQTIEQYVSEWKKNLRTLLHISNFRRI